MNRFRTMAVSLVMLGIAAGAEAALVSFDLDQSNKLPDGKAYARVTIDDEGLPGRINFHVSLLDTLFYATHRALGIDQFGFNSNLPISSRNIIGLPKHWKFDDWESMGGFGRFDAAVEARRESARLSSLDFSVTGFSMDTILDYLDQSAGDACNGNFFFAIRVAGPGGRESGHFKNIFLAGSKLTVPLPEPIPLPASAWLLLGGLGVPSIAFLRTRRSRELLRESKPRLQFATA
jgi:hypothetical protein